MPKAKSKNSRHPFYDNAILLFGLVVVFWAFELLDYVPGFPDFDNYGVVPRERRGLIGIFLAPFLHGNFGHLIGNTLPFLVLGGFVLLSGRQAFIIVTILVALIGGLGIWLLGPANTNHIGASTLIFGYLGFVLLSAWFSRDWREGLIALAAGCLYGSLVLTLLRHTQGISWHGHLFGFVGGVFAAWLIAGDKGRKPRKAPITI